MKTANCFLKNSKDATREQEDSDQHILKDSKARQKNVAMAWFDYKKAYDMVLLSWVVDCLKCTRYTTK